MFREAPQKGEKHYTSTVFLVSEEEPKRVLLMHHKKLDKWMPPGGHQEKFENHIESAIREVLEETGIDISPFISGIKKIDDRASSLPLPDHIYEERIDEREGHPEHYHLDFIQVIRIPVSEVKNSDSESHSLQWFGLEEMQSLELFDNVDRKSVV